MSAERGVAVVTGASSGIGAATAIALAREGFEVIAAARRADRLSELQARHEGIIAWPLDVTDQASVDALVNELADADVTMLAAVAGGAFDVNEIKDADLDSWQHTYDVNVLGTVRTIKAFLPKLVESGRGLIVIMGSVAGHNVYEGGGSYIAAKHAEAAMAKTLRLELFGLPVRVSHVSPGLTRTEEFALNRLGGDTDRAAAVYAGVAEPLVADDIAQAVAWIATRPAHVDIDELTIRPVAQAGHKMHRVL